VTAFSKADNYVREIVGLAPLELLMTKESAI
jgi:hypothetical protein